MPEGRKAPARKYRKQSVPMPHGRPNVYWGWMRKPPAAKPTKRCQKPDLPCQKTSQRKDRGARTLCVTLPGVKARQDHLRRDSTTVSTPPRKNNVTRITGSDISWASVCASADVGTAALGCPSSAARRFFRPARQAEPRPGYAIFLP